MPFCRKLITEHLCVVTVCVRFVSHCRSLSHHRSVSHRKLWDDHNLLYMRLGASWVSLSCWTLHSVSYTRSAQAIPCLGPTHLQYNLMWCYRRLVACSRLMTGLIVVSNRVCIESSLGWQQTYGFGVACDITLKWTLKLSPCAWLVWSTSSRPVSYYPPVLL